MENETKRPPSNDVPVVYVVDDDNAVRESLSWLLRSAGLDAETCVSAEDFVDRYRPDRPGCVVLDLRMPGMSGLQLQEKLAETDIRVPIVMISGHGDVQTAVKAMKAGAVDFIEKPFNDQLLLDAIQKSVDRDVAARRMRCRDVSIRVRYAQLSPRERQVFDHLVRGSRNADVARALGISRRTAEAHRAKLMAKMEAHSLAELVEMGLALRDSTGATSVA
jgi:FixJ family two-component response regulator